MRFSRRDFSESFEEFVGQATTSIDILAISLRWIETTKIISVIDEFLNRCSHGLVTIALMEPNAELKLYDVHDYSRDNNPEALRAGAAATIDRLKSFRDSLPEPVARRLTIATHRHALSWAILIDKGTTDAVIQTEYPLFRCSHQEFFGFELRSDGRFFEANLRSWQQLLDTTIPA